MAAFLSSQSESELIASPSTPLYNPAPIRAGAGGQSNSKGLFPCFFRPPSIPRLVHGAAAASRLDLAALILSPSLSVALSTDENV